jgi:hypothetical protein
MAPEEKKDKPNSLASSLKDNLPIISLGILIVGTINLLIYYSRFGIDILSYLDFTEVLQIQFRLFAYTIGLILYQGIHYIMSTELGANVYAKLAPFTKPESKIDNTSKFYVDRITLAYYLGLFTIVISLGMIMYIIVSTPEIMPVVLYFIIFVIIDYVLYVVYKVLKSRIIESFTDVKDAGEKVSMLKYAVLFVAVVIGSIIVAKFQASYILSHHSQSEVTVVMEKKSFSTNVNYRYIGRTKNFTFFYDKIRKQAETFSNGDIKNLLIRDGVDYSNPKNKKYTFTWSRAGANEWYRKAFDWEF